MHWIQYLSCYGKISEVKVLQSTFTSNFQEVPANSICEDYAFVQFESEKACSSIWFKRLDSMAIPGCPSGPWNVSTPAFAWEELVSQNVDSMSITDIKNYAGVIIEFAHRLCKDTPSTASNKFHRKMWVINFPNCRYMRLIFFAGGILQLDPAFDTQWWSPTYRRMFDGKYVDLQLFLSFLILQTLNA